MNDRDFRTAESLEDEQVRRNQILALLAEKGFCEIRDERRRIGSAESQTINALSPEGERLSMRVKLGWRPRGAGKDWKHFSAVQLMANVKNGDWVGTLNAFVERAVSDGITHFLLVQSDLEKISRAALIPAEEIVGIWRAQSETCDLLISVGQLGKRKKNPAKNGSSPTLWLEDDMAPEVVDHLWDRDTVEDIVMRTSKSAEPKTIANDDTFADLIPDYSLVGTDGTLPFLVQRSFFKRDQKVRAEVLRRSKGICERRGCGATRNYAGFLDVHHILGIKRSDRVWNCVAICPNCHREAHFAPDREMINNNLQEIALSKSRKRRDSKFDPLLALAGSSHNLWADEHADQYVQRLREGWE